MPAPTIQQLIQYLTINGNIGSSSPITSRDIALHFGISDNGVEVEIRDIIRDAIANNYLIASNSQGFYLIKSLSEVENYLDSLESRAENILERRRNILNNWNNQNSTNQSTKQDLFVRP